MSSRKPSAPYQNTDLHVGSRVKSLRLQRGLSQTYLGDQLGISFQQIQKYENGKNRISASSLDGIARVLGVSPSYFFEDSLAQSSPQKNGASRRDQLSVEAVDQFAASLDGIALMRAFTKIKSKPMQHAIVKFVANLANQSVSKLA